MMRATKIAFMLLFLNMGSITGIASDPQRDGVHHEQPIPFPIVSPAEAERRTRVMLARQRRAVSGRMVSRKAAVEAENKRKARNFFWFIVVAVVIGEAVYEILSYALGWIMRFGRTRPMKPGEDIEDGFIR